MAFKNKQNPLGDRMAMGGVGNESFGRASSNVSDAMRNAVQILQKEVGPEFSSYDAVAICQMIMDENYRLEMGDGQGLN